MREQIKNEDKKLKKSRDSGFGLLLSGRGFSISFIGEENIFSYVYVTKKCVSKMDSITRFLKS